MKIYIGKTYQKNFQLDQRGQTPQHLSQHFHFHCKLFFLPQSEIVGSGAGVFVPSDQAEIFFERSHQNIFSFKKGFRRGHRTLKFTKSGEITC